jgi:GST-like protein
MYTLYGAQGSGSASIEVALQICDAPYSIVRAAAWEPDSALEQLARINPLTQIPTLVLPDGTVMSESAAILIHLGLEFPGSGLLPADRARRGQALRGLVFIPANCYSAITLADYPERGTTQTDEAAREAVRQAARNRLHRHWEIFADLFPATPFLSGATLGALDILAAVVSKWSGARAHLGRARPEFCAALARIEAHPAVAPVFARHWPGGSA